MWPCLSIIGAILLSPHKMQCTAVRAAARAQTKTSKEKFGLHFTVFATTQILKAAGELSDTIPNVRLKVEKKNRQLE